MRKPWAALVAVIALAGFLVLYYLVPRLEARWANFGVALTPPLDLLVKVSHLVTRFSLVFMGILAALLFWAFRPEPGRKAAPRE
jgi:type II secretory pathway component PulF